MVGVRVCCPSSFVPHISALVFIFCFIDAEASDCHPQTVIRKKVGEDMKLSCFQGGNVFKIMWKYNGSTITEHNNNHTSYRELFKDRLYLNTTDFSLTVKNLKPHDSGEFKFISIILENQQPKQLPTVFFTLQVVEVLTAPPVLTFTSTRNSLNASCTVVLECSSEAVGRVTYRWTVRNRTTTGSSLTYVLGEEDGDTVFTCTASNSASEVSASKALTCSNRTGDGGEGANPTKSLVLVAVITGCVVALAAGTVLLCVCHRRRQKASLGDQTVYADVSPVAPQNLQEWQPCSLYDSVDNRGKPAPQSIYDKIQFRYMREAESSHRVAT